MNEFNCKNHLFVLLLVQSIKRNIYKLTKGEKTVYNWIKTKPIYFYTESAKSYATTKLETEFKKTLNWNMRNEENIYCLTRGRNDIQKKKKELKFR